MEEIKKRIESSIRELDKSDYEDICKLIKLFIPHADNNIITVINKGTRIDLNKLDDTLLHKLDNMIDSKLQRIHMNMQMRQ
jgi:hypothetical protein